MDGEEEEERGEEGDYGRGELHITCRARLTPDTLHGAWHGRTGHARCAGEDPTGVQVGVGGWVRVWVWVWV